MTPTSQKYQHGSKRAIAPAVHDMLRLSVGKGTGDIEIPDHLGERAAKRNLCTVPNQEK